MLLAFIANRFGWSRCCAAICLVAVLACQPGCTISRRCPDCGMTMISLGGECNGCAACGCPHCRGEREEFFEAEQPSRVTAPEAPCRPQISPLEALRGVLPSRPILNALCEPTIGPRVQAMLMEDQPQDLALPPPQMRRHGRLLIPVPTAPVFGPGTEPPPALDDVSPWPGEANGPPQELPPHDGELRPIDPRSPEPELLDRPESTESRPPQGTTSEPARLGVPGQGGTWTFQPARAAPLGRDQRLAPPGQRAMPRDPARALPYGTSEKQAPGVKKI